MSLRTLLVTTPSRVIWYTATRLWLRVQVIIRNSFFSWFIFSMLCHTSSVRFLTPGARFSEVRYRYLNNIRLYFFTTIKNETIRFYSIAQALTALSAIERVKTADKSKKNRETQCTNHPNTTECHLRHLVVLYTYYDATSTRFDSYSQDCSALCALIFVDIRLVYWLVTNEIVDIGLYFWKTFPRLSFLLKD